MRVNIKSKKAFTLVEMIVSIALIALVSVTLLGIIVPASNLQQNAKGLNLTAFDAANELERKIYGMKEGNTDSSTAGYFTSIPGYTIYFTIGATQYECSGTLIESTSEENDKTVNMWAFVPDEVE